MKNFLSLFIYRLVLIILLPMIMLFFILRSRSNKGFRERLAERFGWLNNNFTTNSLVIHAASVGEVLALRTLVEKLIAEQPSLTITFTTFTPTGSEQVKKLFGDRVQHCYLPLDFFFSTWLFLNKLKPQAIVFMETEIWPNLVRQAKNRGIKMMIINGRISAKTIDKYLALSSLITPCLQQFSCVLTQSDENQQRFKRLGVAQEKCLISGNIKYDMAVNEQTLAKQALLGALLPKNKKIWVMASTHQGDEKLALEALLELGKSHDDILLVLVPRHPERFNSVVELAKSYQLTTQARSSQQAVTQASQVWVLDSLGELIALYGLADIVTIGGSFSDIQGHNPLEPAYFKKPIVVGPKMGNFADIMQQMLAKNAIIQLPDSNTSSLVSVVNELLDNNEQKSQATRQLGENAYQVVEENKGAVNFTLLQLAVVLNQH
ncbi:MAG: lipid IV(A) 3-deoxy-D-manno-octulosonic acid transferase [Thalassotalea sp.]